jgi:hypothetical protein
MTTDMFLGGLMILTLVAGIVIAMTSTRSTNGNRSGDRYDHPRRRESHSPTSRSSKNYTSKRQG